MAHQKARDAVIATLLLARRTRREMEQLRQTQENGLGALLTEIDTNARNSVLTNAAIALWASRGDPVWWFPHERQRAGTETCVQCVSREARFVEEAGVFCDAYCQLLHHHPDLFNLRGPRLFLE